MHSFHTHPLHQSVRGGSQLPLQSAELARPLIAMLFGTIDTAIRRYVAQLNPGSDPLRARNSGAATLTGAWSVQAALRRPSHRSRAPARMVIFSVLHRIAADDRRRQRSTSVTQGGCGSVARESRPFRH